MEKKESRYLSTVGPYCGAIHADRRRGKSENKTEKGEWE